jgi:hypothetical protein
MNAPVQTVIVVGDALYSEGIANTLLESGFAPTVERMPLDAAVVVRTANGPDLFVVCAEGEIKKVDDVIRRISRVNRDARIALIAEAGWEERLDYLDERKLGACVNMSIAREQLICVLRLVMDGFSIV